MFLNSSQGVYYMTELERFDQTWNEHFHRSKFWGRKYYSNKGQKNKDDFENILFSIWKHHNDWDDGNGFQIKCNFDNPKYRTIYRVRKLAEEAGLLIKVGNYYVGDHTNYYKKNLILFDAVFRNQENLYGQWLENSKTNIELDLIYKLLIEDFNNLNKDNNYNLYNMPNVDTNLERKEKRKTKELNYDLKKLYALSEIFLPYYFKLLKRLNRAAIHTDLYFRSFLYFDKKGLPNGRPYSYICSTLNPKKKHRDNSGELRPDFLKRIGIPDYYEVYDIKCEIPRINWLFHTGEWKDDSFDFYKEILIDSELFEQRFINDIYISRGETKRSNYNDSMKQLFMRIYFGKGTDLQSYNGYMQERENRYKKYDDLIKNGKMETDDLIDIMYKNKENIDLNNWQKLCNSTRAICGNPIGNLIFWFSFFIETEVKIELLKRGKKVYNVYDGFYFNQDIKSEIQEILEIKSKQIYNKYMKTIYKNI